MVSRCIDPVLPSPASAVWEIWLGLAVLALEQTCPAIHSTSTWTGWLPPKHIGCQRRLRCVKTCHELKLALARIFDNGLTYCADIAGECTVETGQKVAEQMQTLLDEFHQHLPFTHIVVMAILPKVPSHPAQLHDDLASTDTANLARNMVMLFCLFAEVPKKCFGCCRGRFGQTGAQKL